MRPVAVLGHVAHDVVDGGEMRIGGAPWYAGRALRRLTARACFGIKSGAGDRAAFLNALAANGLPIVASSGGETASFAIDHEGQSRRMSVLAIGEPWTEAEAVRAAGDAAWVHVAPLLRSDFPTETIRALARGRQVLLDAQGLARAAELGPLRLDAAFDRAQLRHVAVLKLAEEEAIALVGSVEAPALAALEVPERVVTLGARGCAVVVRGRLTPVPARPVSVQTGATGAGDAFAAAYLVARAQGHAPESAARRATAVVAAVLA
jgi:sugar/nucleoside kinase (ribokinase family)